MLAVVVTTLAAFAIAAGIWPAERRLSPLGPNDLETRARPDAALTPGVVTGASAAELCAAHVLSRPITSSMRQAVLRDYSMERVPAADYELDYLITPELGGAADRRNLWPQRYGGPVWNARAKDEVERVLPQLVCAGRLSLATAQHDIAADWIAAYRKYLRRDRPLEGSATREPDDDDVVVVALARPHWVGADAPGRHLYR